jgi:adenine-specific DNA-methyltransferase
MSEVQKQELTSMNIAEEQLRKLKELFPEAFTEGMKIDWDKLRLTLGQSIDVGKERYGMNWPGKADCFKTIQQPSIATLIPAREESVDFDTTENLFIEGDNLEVLKLLQKSYLGKIKFMYFDPPYNTGKDFVYPDNYSESLDTYLEYTGQVNSEGRKFGTNTDTDGRFHSKWLNMMYPRLFLSKNLLTEDGIIFLSIDDKEVNNLKSLCNEIFGQENFVAQIVVEGTPKNDPHIVSTAHEYCLVYTKNFSVAKEANYGVDNPLYKDLIEIFDRHKDDYEIVNEKLREYYVENNLLDDNIANYKFSDKDGVFRIGPIDDPQASGSKDNRLNPKTGNFCRVPSRGWSCSIDTWKKWLEGNLILFPESDDLLPSKKTYITEGRLDVLRAYFKMQTRKDTDALKRLFGMETTVFSNPKPIELIKSFISICQDDEFYVLDIFAGSGTTACAVIDLNKDGKKRKFITVQLPEPLDESKANSNKEKKIIRSAISFLNQNKKPLNIAEITKERIRRTILNFENSIKEDMFLKKGDFDLGFKVYSLSKSNFKIWDNTLEKEPEVIQAKLFEHIEHISPEAEQEVILYELLLKSGFELTTPIEKLTLAGLTVFSIAEGQLLICLEKELTHDCIKAMAEMQPTRVICLDEGFKGENADALKTNAVQIMKSKGVVNFRTV